MAPEKPFVSPRAEAEALHKRKLAAANAMLDMVLDGSITLEDGVSGYKTKFGLAEQEKVDAR
jgi:hypothetical protein